MNVCLIPCWRRPEFLHHCITNIVKAEGAEGWHYIFRPDVGASRENIGVIQGFPFSHEVKPNIDHKAGRVKQSFNLLSGYEYASTVAGDGLVAMVEEDVMVGEGFFTFHQSVHTSEPGLFCSIAVKNPNREVETTGDPGAYYLTSDDYCSLGVCFTAERIRTDILPHHHRPYYINPVGYCRRGFRGRSFGDAFSEQDGLIRRIQWKGNAQIAFPDVPRAYHAGFYGYNRGHKRGGTITERIELVGSVIYDEPRMKEEAARPEYFEDSRPVDLSVREAVTCKVRDLCPQPTT